MAQTFQPISITRALAERKLLDSKIATAIRSPMIGIQKGVDKETAEVHNVPGTKVATVESQYKSNFDSVRDLIERRDAITAAIIESNAKTIVTIGGKQMTAAVAIERKKSIELLKGMVTQAMTQTSQVSSSINMLNATLESRIDAAVVAQLGKDKAKYDSKVENDLRTNMTNMAKASPIDPNGLAAWVIDTNEEIAQFETEVDFVLSESNASTKIFESAETPSVTAAEAV